MKEMTADIYLPILRKHWGSLTGMYAAFEDRAPMLEFDVVIGQIRHSSKRTVHARKAQRGGNPPDQPATRTARLNGTFV